MNEDDTCRPGTKAVNKAAFKTPFFEGSLTGDNLNLFLTFATFALIAILAAWVWRHKDDMVETRVQIQASLRDTADGQKKMVKVMTVNTCILSLPPEKREVEFASPNSFCNRMAATQ